MTIVRQEPGIDIGDLAGQPLSVRKGNDSILPAVHKQNRNLNPAQFETPGLHECDFIINNAIPSLPDTLTNTADYEMGKVRC